MGSFKSVMIFMLSVLDRQRENFSKKCPLMLNLIQCLTEILLWLPEMLTFLEPWAGAKLALHYIKETLPYLDVVPIRPRQTWTKRSTKSARKTSQA